MAILKLNRIKLQIFLVLLVSNCLSAQNIISIDTVFGQPQSQIQIFISIENQDPFVSFQLDIPLGGELTYVSNSAALNPQRSNGHLLSANVIAGNKLRIFAYSFGNQFFYGNTGWVAKFKLMTGITPGNYPLNIQNAIIGNQYSQNILTGQINGLVTIVAPLSLLPYAEPENVCLGAAVQLFANPEGGTNSISFEWTSIPPGFRSSLENPVAFPDQPTTYIVEAVDWFESLTGQVDVSIKSGVSIIQQPQPKTVFQGESTFFTILSNGTEPVNFQWYDMAGIIQGAINDTLFLQNVQLQDSGFYHCQITNDCSIAISDQVKLTVIQTVFTQSFLLNEGWNSVSFAYQPLNTEIEIIFQDVLQEVILISDGIGIYYPGGNINTLGNWNIKKGYFVKMLEGEAFSFEGSTITNKAITLESGWNLIPVLSDKAIQVSFIEKQLGTNLLILKEMIGTKVYWPDKNIFSLNRLLTGKTYQIKVQNPQTITY